jgi:hypothetical protein
MTDHSTRADGGKTAAASAPPGDSILREVLAAMFFDCSRGLKENADALPDAAPARELQEDLREFVSNPLLSQEAQFAAYLGDVVIADAFRNFFGDQISSCRTDAARGDVVNKIARLFDALAKSLIIGDDRAQLAAFREYVSDYLGTVRQLNEEWLAGGLRQEMEHL